MIDFVARLTEPGAPDCVTPADRIAVVDNDGTLWSGQPIYFQGLFAIDRLRKMAAEDEGVLTSDALRGAVQGDLAALAATGEAGLREILAITHAGLTVDAIAAQVRDWPATARHPVTGMAHDDMVGLPMLELLRHLRAEGFTTWIVSGGGLHVIRAFAEDACDIPPQQVIGTIGAARHVVTGGEPAIMKDPDIFFIDDNAGKPLAVEGRIGKRPILAVGASDGDFEMLEWSTAGTGPRLGLLIHHTDGARAFAHDRDGGPSSDRARGRSPSRAAGIVPMLAAPALALLPGGAIGQAQSGHVGSRARIACHQDVAAAWAGSHHAHAWTPPSPGTVSADFDDAVFAHDGMTARFRVEADGHHVTVTEKDGVATGHRVHSVVGIEPPWQCLLETEPGRLQSFDVVWDADKGGWFHLCPDQTPPPGDGLH